MGPLIDAGAVRNIRSHIEDVGARDARIIFGDRAHQLGGSSFQPTAPTVVLAMRWSRARRPSAPSPRFIRSCRRGRGRGPRH